ncbi:hypothetical protein D3C72_2081200 [compost metagenome]
MFDRRGVVIEQFANFWHLSTVFYLAQGNQWQRAGVLHLFLLRLIPYPGNGLYFHWPLDF